MKKFTDGAGAEWKVQVTLATAKRLRSEGRDLLDVAAVNKMLADPIELFDLLYLVCEPQAKEDGVDDEAFGVRMAACMNEAAESLVEELELFFQQVGRPAMAALIQRVWTASKTEQQKATDLINGQKATTAIDSAIKEAMDEAETNLDELSGATSMK